MNKLRNLWVKASKWFDSLPSPVKAIFWVTLNALTALFIQDLQALDVTNKYLIVLISGGVNLLTYISIYFGSRKEVV